MKTTVEISDALLAAVRRKAAQEGCTIRDWVEEGLRTVLARREQARGYKYRPVTFRGKGLCPGFQDAPWEKFRDAIYEGRGGTPR